MTVDTEMPPTFVEALAQLVIDTEGDGVNYRRNITLKEALGEQAVVDIAAEAWASVDWRVLGGLVPGVIDAAWVREGDRIRVAAIEGTVIAHTVDEERDAAQFVVRTDAGAEVAFERWRSSEIRVITPGVTCG